MQGLTKEVRSSCCASGAEAGFKKQTHECCQHCFRGCRNGRSACQCSAHTPHTATSHHPRRKPLLKLAHKKAHKQFSEDNLSKSMNYWNHLLWSDEIKINLFGSDGVQHVWRRPGEEYQENCILPTVKHGDGSNMVRGCMSAAGNMDSNMYCDILKQNMMPSLQKMGRTAVFQHNDDPKHTTKMTTALLMRVKVKVMEWPSMSPDLNPTEHMWIILQWKVDKHHVSNIQQLRDVIMEEWKSIPATNCAALVNSMPRRIKAVLDNNQVQV